VPLQRIEPDTGLADEPGREPLHLARLLSHRERVRSRAKAVEAADDQVKDRVAKALKADSTRVPRAAAGGVVEGWE
jgi:hypothetical protein